MKASFWSPAGLLRSSGLVPAAKKLHEDARRLLGDPKNTFTDAPGGFADTLAAAMAMTLAWVDAKVTRAGEQQGSRAYDLLKRQEEEHGITPSPFASVAARQAALRARLRLPDGASRAATEEALRTLLGSSYVGLHITAPLERVMWPASLGDQPMALKVPTVDRKLVKTIDAISIGLGYGMVVPYEPLEPVPSDPTVHTLVVGDELVLEPEIEGRAEVVTVTELGTASLPGGDVLTFTAVVTNAHEPGAFATTMPWPMWWSSQREIVVVVKASAATDPETRRQVHDLLERLEPGVTTWALVQEGTTPNTAGPFTLDDPVLGLLDVTPLGSTTVTTP